ncbi:MAG: aldehyde dehydrogenase family protein [Nitrososphaerota archaeon]
MQHQAIYYNYLAGEWTPAGGGKTFPPLKLAHRRQVIGYSQSSMDGGLRDAEGCCIWVGFGTKGKRRTTVNRVIIHNEIYDRFINISTKRVKCMRNGYGLDPMQDMGPLVNERQLHKIHEYVGIGRSEGAQPSLAVSGLTMPTMRMASPLLPFLRM